MVATSAVWQRRRPASRSSGTSARCRISRPSRSRSWRGSTTSSSSTIPHVGQVTAEGCLAPLDVAGRESNATSSPPQRRPILSQLHLGRPAMGLPDRRRGAGAWPIGPTCCERRRNAGTRWSPRQGRARRAADAGAAQPDDASSRSPPTWARLRHDRGRPDRASATGAEVVSQLIRRASPRSSSPRTSRWTRSPPPKRWRGTTRSSS